MTARKPRPTPRALAVESTTSIAQRAVRAIAPSVASVPTLLSPLVAAVEPIIARAIAVARLDEAKACLSTVTMRFDGATDEARQALKQRIARHRKDARR
jgi:hypothetical protein